MYDQGQVSTSIYYQNDKYGWPKSIRTEIGGKPEAIKRDKGYIPNSILQFDSVSNDHLATRQLTLSHAIPLPVNTEQQLQEPFRFYIEDMKNMSVQDRVNIIHQQFDFEQNLDGIDEYIITFFDGRQPNLPKIYPGKTIVAYYRSLYMVLAYLDVYYPEKSPKFAKLSNDGASLESMMDSVRDYYRVCMDTEKEYMMQDNSTSVAILLGMFPILAVPNNHYLIINRKLKEIFDDITSQQLTRTSAYFIFRLIPRLPSHPLVNKTLIQQILNRLIPIFTTPRPGNMIRADPMETEQPLPSDEELLMARFDNEREKLIQKRLEEEQYNRVRLAWLLKHNYAGENQRDRDLLKAYYEEVAPMAVDTAPEVVDNIPKMEIDDEEVIVVLPDIQPKETMVETDDKEAVPPDMEQQKRLKDARMTNAPGSGLTKDEAKEQQAVRQLPEDQQSWDNDKELYLAKRLDRPELFASRIVYPVTLEIPVTIPHTPLEKIREKEYDRSQEMALATEVFLSVCREMGITIYVASKFKNTTVFAFPRCNPQQVQYNVDQIMAKPEKERGVPSSDLYILNESLLKDLISKISQLDVKNDAFTDSSEAENPLTEQDVEQDIQKLMKKRTRSDSDDETLQKKGKVNIPGDNTLMERSAASKRDRPLTSKKRFRGGAFVSE